MPWGFHSILNIAKACPKSIRCSINISNFSNTLVKRIDMIKYGEPQVFKFGQGNKLGYTLIQPIETSCITAHFTEEDNGIYLDIFSCKPFKKEIINQTVYEYFLTKEIEHIYLERQVKQELV